MKKYLALAVACLLPSVCGAQSIPPMDRRVTLQGPTGLNWAMSLKADAKNGVLTNPTAKNGTYTAPSISGGYLTNSTLDNTSVLNGTNISQAMSTVLGAKIGRYLSAKLLDVVSVRDFGAKGDGTTDDTAAINAAITYSKTTSYHGGTIFFPDGVYLISSTINLTGTGFSLVGQSQRGATILAGFTSGNIVQIGNGNGNDDNEQDSIRGLHITSQSKMTSGSAIWAEGVVNLTIDYVLLDGPLNSGIDIENPAGTTFGVYLSHLWIAGINNEGLTIGGQSTSPSTVVTDVFLNDVMILPGQSAADCGICLFGVGGFYASGVDITSQGTSHFNNAIKIDPPNTSDVNAVMLSRVLADSSNNENISFQGVGPIADVTITNGWANTSNGGSGIVFNNAQTDGVTIAASAVDSNAQYGIVINKGVNIAVTGSRVLNNSMSSSGNYDGIAVGSGVSAFSITNNQIGNGGWFNVSGHSAIHQRWAVNINANAGGGFVVSNNRGFNNTSGMVNDQTTGTNKSIIGNVNG